MIESTWSTKIELTSLGSLLTINRTVGRGCVPSDRSIIDFRGYQVADMGGVGSVTCGGESLLLSQKHGNFLDVWLWCQSWTMCSTPSSLQGSYYLKNVTRCQVRQVVMQLLNMGVFGVPFLCKWFTGLVLRFSTQVEGPVIVYL